MSALKPALITLGAAGVIFLLVALAVPYFTSRSAPVQVEVANPAEAAADAEAPLTRPVHVRDARHAEPLAGIYQAAANAGASRADWTHSYDAEEVGSCTATLALGSAAAADWSEYAERTLSLDADGLASLAVPAGTEVQSRLTVQLGGSPAWSIESPLRDAWWQGGRARLFLSDASTRALIPAAAPNAQRSATLTVQASPLDRCDRLDFRWESRAVIELSALSTTSANAPVDAERLLPACTQSGNILEYVGPGGGSEPYDYECEEASAGGGDKVHLTLPDYEMKGTAPSAAGEAQPTSTHAVIVAFQDYTPASGTTIAAAKAASEFTVGDRVRIAEQSPGLRWYEGTITVRERAPNITLSNTFALTFDEASDDGFGYDTGGTLTPLDDAGAVLKATTIATCASTFTASQNVVGCYDVIRVGSGLDKVHTASPPFTGDGTVNTPLGLLDATTTASGAMSAADKAKLDGIDAGAQADPPLSVSFAAEDADTDPSASLQDGEIGFYNKDNNQVQSGNINQAKRIYVANLSAAYGDDPTIPGTNLSTIDTRPLLGWLESGNGGAMVSVERQGHTETVYFVAASIGAYGTNGYELSISHTSGSHLITGTGNGWNVRINPIHPDSFHNMVDWDEGLAAAGFVKVADLAGKSSDRYSSYDSGSGGYWPGSFAFYNQSSGVPAAANIIGQPYLTDGTRTLALGRLRTDRDPNNLIWDSNTCPPATDYSIGDVIYLSPWNKAGQATFTLTSAGTQTGTGNGCHTYMVGTLSGASSIIDVADDGDYILLAEQAPTQIPIEIPYSDVLGGDGHWLRVDGSNATQATKDSIQGDNEESTLANTFRVDVTNVDYYAQLNEPGGGQPNTAIIRLPSSAANSQDDVDLKRLVKPAAWVEVGDYTIDVTSNYSRAIVGTSLTFTFNYVAVNGTKPSGSTPVKVRVVGEDVHRGQLARQAFAEETPSIAGKGGSSGQVWTRGSGDANAGWGATVTGSSGNLYRIHGTPSASAPCVVWSTTDSRAEWATCPSP